MIKFLKDLRTSCFLIVGITACAWLCSCQRTSKLSEAPFLLDSLVSFNYDKLVQLANGSTLQDSFVHDASGKPRRFTIFMPKTNLEAIIQWEDTARQSVQYVTIRGNAARSNLWRTRDSLAIGMSMADVERINKGWFMFSNGGVQDLQKQLGKKDDRGYLHNWGEDGKLWNRVYLIRLDANIKQPKGASKENIFFSSSAEAKANNPKLIEITLDRSVLPNTIAVESIAFKNRGGSTNIPRVIDRSGRSNEAVDNINAKLLEFFMIDSFDPKKAQDFSWSDVKFTSEIENKMLYLRINATYTAAYSTDQEEEFFFSLVNGEREEDVSIPFHWLLALDGYIPFFQKYWTNECRPKMAEAASCAGLEPTCSCADVGYKIANNKITLNLNNEECYPHAAMACAPTQSLAIPLADLTNYLNPVAKKLFESGYFQKSRIEQHELAYRIHEQLPDDFFIRWNWQDQAGDTYPDLALTMSLQFAEDEAGSSTGAITGFAARDPWPEGQPRPELNAPDATPFPVTGTFDLNGFVVKGPFQFGSGNVELIFKWHDDSWESDGKSEVRVGGRYLSPDAAIDINYVRYMQDRFFMVESEEEEEEAP